MKIKILRSTVCGGKVVAAGKTVGASEDDARYLVAIGKASYVDEQEKPTGGLTTESAAAMVKGKEKSEKK